tara:strand:- start:1551 stop:1964 length:414 start_codon:yes stop_codon:yes gene_type:complete
MTKKILSNLLILLIIFQFISFFSNAVEPEEFLQNPKNELRARSISKKIRCLVCQNQSIDDSTAPLAKDLRILIRKKIQQGKTDKEIYNFLTLRYGDFILLKPPLKISTLALWALPLAFFIIGIFGIFIYNKKSKKNI